MAIQHVYEWSSISDVGNVSVSVNKSSGTFVTSVSASGDPVSVTTDTGSAITSVTASATVSGTTVGNYDIKHTHYDDEYLTILTTLNSHMETIKDYMIALNQYTDDLVTITNEMKEDIQRFRERGENEQLGVYVRGVLDIDSLERAAIIHGLKKNNIFNDVVAETSNPTPMP